MLSAWPVLVSLLFQDPAQVEFPDRSFLTALEEYVADGQPPGVSAGIALPDGTVHALAAGLADRAEKTPLGPLDRMCAGSTGKTFVAATVLQLVEEERLRLRDLAGEVLGEEPWFERLPNAAELTVEMLLRHRTGIERHEFMTEFMQAVVAEPDRVWAPEELVGYVLGRQPKFEAGGGFAYSDTNYILLGMIVERVTGRTLYEEVRERFLEPLGLTTTLPQDSRSIPELVNGYAGQGFFGLPDAMLGADGRFVVNPQFEWAGGGFVTSGGDLARWARALYAGNLLPPDLLQHMVTGMAAPELGQGMEYGLGCEIWTTEHGPCWGHAGFFPGYLTEMRYWPKQGIAVAVQVNTSDRTTLGMPLGELCEELLEIALAPAIAPR